MSVIYSFLFSASAFSQGDCGFLGVRGTKSVSIDRVVDGDTVVLLGGKRLRLLGINTPELGRDGRPAEPFAEAAKLNLQSMLTASDDWRVSLGVKKKDRHGRLLGYLHSDSQGSAGAALLQKGLAFVVAVEDDRHVPCFQELEREARQQNLGVWSVDHWLPVSAASVDDQHLGFGRFTGSITKIDYGTKLYVEVENRLVVIVSGGAQQAYGAGLLLGRRIDFRGWLAKRHLSKVAEAEGHKPYVVYLNNAFMFTSE